MSGKLTDLSFVGEKRAKLFEKLGIKSVKDFLTYFPRDYEDRRQLKRIADVTDGEKVCVRAVVAEAPAAAAVRKGMTLIKFRAFDDSGFINVTFFNAVYIRSLIKQGDEYIFFGQAQRMGNFVSMANPLFEKAHIQQETRRIIPIYSLTKGISNKMIMAGVDAAMKETDGRFMEILPAPIVEELQLIEPAQAYTMIHSPEDFDQVEKSRRRLIFEELFVFCCAGQRLKGKNTAHPGIVIPHPDIAEYMDWYPYSPTNAQKKAVSDIMRDMSGGLKMNRLLQGDVGSGKTFVAGAAVFAAVKSGRQAAIMAPTEILATQHYEDLGEIFEAHGIRCGLLTGSSASKKKVKQSVADGSCDVLFGTHAIIQRDVEFFNPGLFVVDEQHRFGVSQRAALSEKNPGSHLLVMSATPIPRTLALIFYGDLDISVLDEMPPGRQRVLTYCAPSGTRQRMHGFLKKEIDDGGQVYIVCPLIDSEEQDDRATAVQYSESLKKTLPGVRVEMMHGKLKPAEKDRIMQAFSAGSVDILVSTTVIEVGVNVPNASIMVVENADFFGLSQLHQLRGRVGRGVRQSYCFLMHGADIGETALRRLKTLRGTNDGFKIAEEDLRLRGPGDFFGNKQHGLPEFKLASFFGDATLLEQAAMLAKQTMAQPEEEHPLLIKKVDEIIAQTDASTLN